MKICVVKEQAKGEKRVALTPDLVKRYKDLGWSIHLETGAGEAAGYTDDMYKKLDVSISGDIKKDLKAADVVLHVAPLSADVVKGLKKECIVIGQSDPFNNMALLKNAASKNVTMAAMEFVPRITRAQSMDVLSSQANLAGYRAVIEAVQEGDKVWPMMMTAAGTVAPAKVFVMGAGVAGLQAIATAKRLGASVSATDVRMAAKEQVESLGAQFVMVEDEEAANAETAGGYAKEMSEAYKKKQADLIASTITKQDVVITTALIPGRPAPVLISEAMVKTMKPGSVIIDMAVAQGGNCPISEKDKVVIKHGVKIAGYTNLPAHVAPESSKLYARNLFEYVKTLLKIEEGSLSVQTDDKIWQESCVVSNGEIVHPRLLDVSAKPSKKAAAKAPAKKSAVKKASQKKTKAAAAKASTAKKAKAPKKKTTTKKAS